MNGTYGLLLVIVLAVQLLAGCGGQGSYYGFSFPSGGIGLSGGSAGGRKMTGDVSIGTVESGTRSERGLVAGFESRILELTSLPSDQEGRMRLAFVTLGARYHFASAFAGGRRSTGTVTGSGQYYTFRRGADIDFIYQVLGAGVFARSSPLAWTNFAYSGANGDWQQKYDPYVEAGAFGLVAMPFMYGLGVELSAGGGYGAKTGALGFLRLDLLLGHRGYSEGPDPNFGEPARQQR